jgi:hypothetical protein
MWGETMSERYQIICPDCRVALPQKDVPKICPTCNQDITNSYEILFRPAAQGKVAKIIAVILLAAFAVLLFISLVTTYF